MYGLELNVFSYWWIVPVIMMVLCVLSMRGSRCSMMCGLGSRGFGCRGTRDPDSAMEILKRRYASGEIKRDEYEETKRALTESPEAMKGQGRTV